MSMTAKVARAFIQKAMKSAGSKVPKLGDISSQIKKAEKKGDKATVKKLKTKKTKLLKAKKAIADKDKSKKDLAAKNKETRGKKSSATQKNLKFRRKYDVQEGMGLDAETGGSRRAAQDVDQGKAGKVTATPGKNFVQSQMNKTGLKRAKTKVSLENKVKAGDATKAEKTKLKKMKAADAEATRRQQSGRRGKVKLEKGDYVNTKTGEVITNPESLADLKGGRDLYVKDPTPPRMEAIKRNAEARGMTSRERTMKALRETKPVFNPKTGKSKYESATKLQKTPRKETTNIGKRGGTGRNRQNLNRGGLTKPTANQTGLKKLPTAVRNKMGYMYGGGMSKKPRMSNMDYRKGGMVLIALDFKKKKGK